MAHPRILPPDPPLRDGDVVLRLAREDDLAGVYDEAADEESQRWFNIERPYTHAAARQALDWFRSWDAPGDGLTLVIADAATDEYAGAIVLFVSERTGVGELAYGVGPDFRGRGMMTTAVRLVSRWAFDELGLQRLELRTHQDNAASQRVAEKAGFTREGIERGSREVRGDRFDPVVFSLLPGDPR